MSESAFFKVKNSKRSNPEARTTLDAIHHQRIQQMTDQKEHLSEYKEELAQLNEKIAQTSSDIELWKLERDRERLEKKIKTIEDGTDVMDCYTGWSSCS